MKQEAVDIDTEGGKVVGVAGLKDEDEERQRRNISGLWFLGDHKHSTMTDYSSVYIRG